MVLLSWPVPGAVPACHPLLRNVYRMPVGMAEHRRSGMSLHIIHRRFKNCPILGGESVVSYRCSQGIPKQHRPRLRGRTKDNMGVPVFLNRVKYVFFIYLLSLFSKKLKPIRTGWASAFAI